jgi:hypothetical protein
MNIRNEMQKRLTKATLSKTKIPKGYTINSGLIKLKDPSEEKQEPVIRNAQDILEEFLACEQKWDKARVPTQNELKVLLKNNSLVQLNNEVQLLKNTQPNCEDLKRNYEVEFSKYQQQVNHAIRVTNLSLHQFDHLLVKSEQIDNLKKTIDKLIKMRNQELNHLTTKSIEYTSRVLSKLGSLKQDVDNANSKLLIELERIKNELDRNQLTLRELLESTHEWVTSISENKKRCSKCLELIDLGVDKEPHTTVYEEESKDYPHYW